MSTQEPRRASMWVPSLVALLAVLLLVGAGVGFFGNLGSGPGASSPQSDQTSTPHPEESRQSGEEQDAEPQSGHTTPEPEQSASTPDPSADAGVTRNNVTPSIVSAEYAAGSGISARALVPDVVDLEGTCTLTATQGETVREVTGQAMTSADSMNCARDLTIPDDELQAGTWTVTVSYDSDAFAGVSAPANVQVIR